MDPVFVEIGSLKIHWYGVMMASAFVVGLWNWFFLGKREGRTFDFCSDLLVWIIVSSIIGARLVHVLSHIGDYAKEPWRIFFLHEGGLVYYGGFLGAAVGLWVFARKRDLGLLSLLDLVITSVPLGHALGRVGCFLNGCCFGKITEHAMAVRYPKDSQPWYQHRIDHAIGRFQRLSAPVHPVQLYEAAANLAIFAILVIVYLRRKRDGLVTGTYLVIYPLCRFAFEFLRGDERLSFLGLSFSQWVSIVLLVFGFLVLWQATHGQEKNGAID